MLPAVADAFRHALREFVVAYLRGCGCGCGGHGVPTRPAHAFEWQGSRVTTAQIGDEPAPSSLSGCWIRIERRPSASEHLALSSVTT
jgi:hypothetical protein